VQNNLEHRLPHQLTRAVQVASPARMLGCILASAMPQNGMVPLPRNIPRLLATHGLHLFHRSRSGRKNRALALANDKAESRHLLDLLKKFSEITRGDAGGNGSCDNPAQDQKEAPPREVVP